MLRFSKDVSKEEFYERSVAAWGTDLPASNCSGFCQYRTDDGRACLIGVFLPDGVATDITGTVGVNWREVKDYMPAWMTRELACAVQMAHDTASSHRLDLKYDGKLEDLEATERSKPHFAAKLHSALFEG